MVKLSIFKKIVIILFLIGTIPLFVFGLFTVNKIYTTAKKDALERNALIVRQFSYQIDLYLQLAQMTFERLAASLLSVDFEPEKVKEVFKLYSPQVATISGKRLVEFYIVVNKEGIVETTYPLKEEYLGLNYSKEDFYKEIIQKKRLYLSSRTEISLYSGEPIIKIALPILDKQGNFSHILLTELNAKNLIQLTGMTKIGKTGDASVINSQGEVIFHPEYEAVLKHQKIDDFFPGLFSKIKEKYSGEIIFQPKGKSSVLITYSTISFTDWKVLFHQSLPEVIYLFSAIKNYLILVFFLIIFFVGSLSFFLSRGITRPLKNLTEAVKTIARGDLKTKIKLETGDEIEELAAAFNEMIEELSKSKWRLEEAKTVLEIKVAARTKELRELAESLDEKVKEKTKELQEKMADLEKFHKLAVGRELKMIELKKALQKAQVEIEKLKELEKKVGKNIK